MSRRQGHIEERSPGHWLIRYSVTEAGGRRRFSTTIKGTRKEAEKELRRRLDALDEATHVDPNRITVREWLTRWLDTVRAEIAPKTHERYGEIVNHYLSPALGALQLAKLAPVHIQKCYSDLAEGGRRDGKPGALSPQTRRHIHRVLHAALARAVELQLLARNPAEAFKKRQPRVERLEMMTLTVEQSRLLLDAVRRSHIYWPVLLALTTGMRRGEILALRWKNVSDNSGTVHVAESLEQTKAGLRFKPRRAAGRAPSPSPPSRSRNCAGLNASRPSNY